MDYFDMIYNSNLSDNDSKYDEDNNIKRYLDLECEENNEKNLNIDEILKEWKELNLYTLDFDKKYEDDLKFLFKGKNKIINNDEDKENKKEKELGNLKSKMNKIDLNNKLKTKKIKIWYDNFINL